MKKHGKTIVPRNKDMNEYLVALGHKPHKDKRQKRLKNKQKDEHYNDEWN